jgi:hypothetical protein
MLLRPTAMTRVASLDWEMLSYTPFLPGAETVPGT